MGYASGVLNFGEFLRSLMHDLGMDARELARLVGRSERTIYNWLDAEKPSGRAMVLLADALDIPLDTLRAAAAGKSSLPDEFRNRERAKRVSTRIRFRPPQSDDLPPLAAGLIRLATSEQSDRLDELLQMVGREALQRLAVAFVQQLAEWAFPFNVTDEFLYQMADVIQPVAGCDSAKSPQRRVTVAEADPENANPKPRSQSGANRPAGHSDARSEPKHNRGRADDQRPARRH